MASDMIYPYLGVAIGLFIGWWIEKRLNVFSFIWFVALLTGAAISFIGGIFLVAFSGHDFGYLPGIIALAAWLIIWWWDAFLPSPPSSSS